MIDRVKTVIHLDHLWHNYQLLKTVHFDKKLMAVVKADAYGHGAIKVATYLEKMGCEHFAVTDLIEGIELREAGIKAPILIFGKTSPKHASKINQYNLIQTVDDYVYAKALNDKRLDIKVHMIIDTGMSRFGVYLHDEKDMDLATSELCDIFNLDHIKQEGIYMHFAVADEDKDEMSIKQFDLFTKLCDNIKQRGYDLGIRHCTNSAGILKFPQYHLDMSRTGIAMYGYPPIETKLKFKPVMDVIARVIAIRTLKPGDVISYGSTFEVKEKMKVASIAIGYADGYNRLFSNKDYFIYQGHQLPIVGRVCMGVTMVDSTSCDLRIGDFVEVFGSQKPLKRMADMIGTITYELLTNMSKHRVHYDYLE